MELWIPRELRQNKDLFEISANQNNDHTDEQTGILSENRRGCHV